MSRYYRDLQQDTIPAGTDESTLLLLRALSDRDRQKRLVRELQQQLAALQSQPRLQPVTPEAMAELKRREAWVILFRHKESVHCRYCVVRWDAVAGRWWGTPAGEESPLDWQWFIEPSTLPEVQQ